MRRLSLICLIAAAALSVSAQNKIDFAGRMVFDAVHSVDIVSRAGSALPLRTVELPYAIAPDMLYSAIVVFDGDLSDIQAKGVEIVSQRNGIAIVSGTAAQLQSVAALPQVDQLSFGSEVRPMMNNARATTGVDAVQKGSDGLGGTKYTGRGVVTGLMDQGLDVNHVNFLTADGQPRTKALWVVNSATDILSYDTPEKILSFTTENKDATHGTHVLGIMAGSYNGAADYVVTSRTGSSIQSKKQNGSSSAIPYYGVATESDIAVACGSFTGAAIEAGAAKVVEYAKSVGQPCVLNLSIGNTYGPHDGTDARSRFLASLGEDAIVCVAAGNEGSAPVSISHDFKAEPLGTFVSSNAVADGMADFWGADSRLFTVRFIGYDKTTGEEVFSYPVDKNLEGSTIYLTGSYYTAAGYIHDEKFDELFGTRGALIISSNIDPANNRYNVSFNLQLAGASSSNIVPGFIVEAAAGQHVDAFANGDIYFTSLGVDGFSDGTPDCSISGMACGDNILVVGSYTNVAMWPVMSLQFMQYTNKPVAGAISSFSSYGETFDGRRLPDVCGPGGSILSSYSLYYVNRKLVDSKGEVKLSSISGMYTGAKRISYWAEMQGTSMACPFVAGVIATWLQANPTLTIDEVKAVINRTATHDSFTEVEPERWGAGKINALAGLKDILGQSGISDVAADSFEPIVTSADNRSFDIFVAGASVLRADIVSLSGQTVASASSNEESLTVDASSVAPGIYILNVVSPTSSHTRKIVVK